MDPCNHASRALLRTLSFKKENVLRDYELEKREYIDLIMASQMKREWKYP